MLKELKILMKKHSFRCPNELERSLSEYCETNKINISDGVVKLLGIALLQENPKPWSPTSEYNLQNEPGMGYDQTKGRWIPETREIRSYQEKVQARQLLA